VTEQSVTSVAVVVAVGVMVAVGVIVAVWVGVGLSEVALGVRVEGKGVTEGRGVKVCVAVRTGVSEGGTEAVNVQVGGSLKGVRSVGEVTVVGCWALPAQPNRNRKTIRNQSFESCISASEFVDGIRLFICTL
jgi:hypothetical protein